MKSSLIDEDELSLSLTAICEVCYSPHQMDFDFLFSINQLIARITLPEERKEGCMMQVSVDLS